MPRPCKMTCRKPRPTKYRAVFTHSILTIVLLAAMLGTVLVSQPVPVPAPPQPPAAGRVDGVIELAERLQSQQVTVVTPGGQGSAVLFERTINGRKYQFAWTAGHVVQDRAGVRADHVQLVRQHFTNGRRSGQTSVDARVMAFSDPQTGYDLALLRLDGRFEIRDSGVVFDLSGRVPPAGMGVYHVGSFLGLDGSCSFSLGVIAQSGRVLDGLPHEFDQITAPAFPGSSGGGVYDEDGNCIGLLVRGADATFGFVAPARLMREWAEEEGLMWAMDPSLEASDAL